MHARWVYPYPFPPFPLPREKCYALSSDDDFLSGWIVRVRATLCAMDAIQAAMSRFLLVVLGGAIGSGARYLAGSFCQSLFGAAFPYGTLAVNVVGSFCICAIMQLATATDAISPAMRLFLTTGIMGGFTTYSAFDYEIFRYAQEGAYVLAAWYALLTLAACFVAGALGDGVARHLYAH
jgi:fluoride exporter